MIHRFVIQFWNEQMWQRKTVYISNDCSNVLPRGMPFWSFFSYKLIKRKNDDDDKAALIVHKCFSFFFFSLFLSLASFYSIKKWIILNEKANVSFFFVCKYRVITRARTHTRTHTCTHNIYIHICCDNKSRKSVWSSKQRITIFQNWNTHLKHFWKNVRSIKCPPPPIIISKSIFFFYKL